MRRLLPRTITAQITGLVVATVLLSICLTSAVPLYYFRDWNSATNSDIMAAVRAARIATIVRAAEAAGSPAKIADLLAESQQIAANVEWLKLADLGPAPVGAPVTSPLVASIKQDLQTTWGIVPIETVDAARFADAIIIRIDDHSALVFRESIYMVAERVLLAWGTVTISIIALLVVSLSIYAVRWITSPLSSIAAAARSFGRLSDAAGELREDGPREIAQVAEALNDMRARVRSLVSERTRMLAAISHDLRTPLTRLRLRAERLADADARERMVRDITAIDGMLNETLVYLREEDRAEPFDRLDLPSLLQTICAEFADIGHAVSYEGPGRFAFACRGRALTRAVANIIENGTKHGSAVLVALRVRSDTAIEIDVSDDGPGIPSPLRERVFEPFFKGDSARPATERAGFGLGLSIAREIARKHGGEIDLLDRPPHGLTVRLSIAAGNIS